MKTFWDQGNATNWNICYIANGMRMESKPKYVSENSRKVAKKQIKVNLKKNVR